MKYHFKVHTHDKFWAECIELEGCNTQAHTMPDLMKNMKEILDLCLEEALASNLEIMLPQKSVKHDCSIMVDPQISLAILIKNYRKKNNFSQSQMATKLGMNNIYSYQRLERKADVRLSTLSKIHDVFPDFPIKELF